MTDGSDRVLACDLGAVPLTEVLQLAEASRLTGLLTVGTTEIRWCEGRMVGASCGERTGLCVVLDLFLVDRGRAVFDRREVKEVGADPALADGFAVQMQGCQLADEWDRRAADVYAPLGTASGLGGLPFDGQATLEAVIIEAGGGWSGVASAVLASIERGELEHVGRGTRMRTAHMAEVAAVEIAEPAIPADAPEVDVDGAISLGRRAYKDGRFSDAIRHFQVALDLRPDDRVVAQNLRRSLAAASTMEAA